MEPWRAPEKTTLGNSSGLADGGINQGGRVVKYRSMQQLPEKTQIGLYLTTTAGRP
jgi:hypothetical protein